MNSLLFEKILTYKSKSEEDEEIKSAIDFVSLIRDHYYSWLFCELKMEDHQKIDPEKFLNLRKFLLDILLDFLIDKIICDENTECIYIFPDQHNIKFSRFDSPEYSDIETIIENCICHKCKCDLSREFYYSYDSDLEIDIYICFNCKGLIKRQDDNITPDNTIQNFSFLYKSFEEYKIANSRSEKDKILIYDLEDDTYYYTDEESDYEDNIYSLNLKIKEDPDVSELEYQSVIKFNNTFNENLCLDFYKNYNEILEHKLQVHSYYKLEIKFPIYDEWNNYSTLEFIIDNSTGSPKITNRGMFLFDFELLDSLAYEYIQNRLNEEYIKNNRELYTIDCQGPYIL